MISMFVNTKVVSPLLAIITNLRDSAKKLGNWLMELVCVALLLPNWLKSEARQI